MMYSRMFAGAVLMGLPAVLLAGVGGGYTNAGLKGEYFSGESWDAPNLKFVRNDVRVDFDWDTWRRPGGSIDPAYQMLGTDNYAIRWTGQVIPRFSETYRFSAVADDYLVLKLRKAGDASWKAVISQEKPGMGAGEMLLEAGQKYDVEVLYKEGTGPARASLRWSSPSTPEEVIDPVAGVGTGFQTSMVMWADRVLDARPGWEPIDGKGFNNAKDVDEHGWPKKDCSYYWWEGDADATARGQFTFSFRGRADVGGVNGIQSRYDAATNITRGTFAIPTSNPSAVVMLQFRNTDRDGDGTAFGPDSGFTELKIMLPSAAGDMQAPPIPEGTIVHPQVKEALGTRVSHVRFQGLNSFEVKWSDRTEGLFMNQREGRTTAWDASIGVNPFGLAPTHNKASWEYQILFANTTGRDLMIGVPTWADDDYLRKLAQLIRYGSDGILPYTGPAGSAVSAENPRPVPAAGGVFPPLNPNLKVYIEIANEIWNWAAPYWPYRQIDAIARKHADTNSETFRTILNYDNLPTTKAPNGNYNNQGTWARRWIGMRYVQISEIFRGVVGDANMSGTSPDPQIRVMFEGWGPNTLEFSSTILNFMDAYYNKTDPASTFAGTPRPVNYYLWGHGAQAYYGARNTFGIMKDTPANSSFETPAINAADGFQKDPVGSGFAFVNDAGFARSSQRQSIQTAAPTLGAAMKPVADTWYGMQFTTGDKPLHVYELGRWADKAAGGHELRLIRVSDNAVVTYGTLQKGEAGKYSYVKCVPVTLQPHTAYCLISREGSEPLHDEGTAITTTADITVNNAVSCRIANNRDYRFTAGAAGKVFGPLDLKYTTAATLNNPDPTKQLHDWNGSVVFDGGSQVGYLRSYTDASGKRQKGEISFTFDAPAGQSEHNRYALIFRAHQRHKEFAYRFDANGARIGGEDQQFLRIFINGTDVTTHHIMWPHNPQQPVAYNPDEAWANRTNPWFSAKYIYTDVAATKPGEKITVRIVGDSNEGDQVAFLDDLRVCSSDTWFASGAPQEGTATGQPETGIDLGEVIKMQAKWTTAFGLNYTNYEGSMYFGDQGATRLCEHIEHRDPRSRQVEMDFHELFNKAAGPRAVVTLTTYLWPDKKGSTIPSGMWTPSAWPQMQALEGTYQRLSAEPENGVAIPATIKGDAPTLAVKASKGRFSAAGGWMSYNLIVPATGDYAIALTGMGAGELKMEMDGRQILPPAPAAGPRTIPAVKLVRGLHTIRIIAASGTPGVDNLVVSRAAK